MSDSEYNSTNEAARRQAPEQGDLAAAVAAAQGKLASGAAQSVLSPAEQTQAQEPIDDADDADESAQGDAPAPVDPDDPEAQDRPLNPNAMVSCENLVKIYKTKDLEVLALQGLDLAIEKGELMAIIGNSGSGKSTLLNMLGGLDRPSAGRLFVDGKNLLRYSDQDLTNYRRTTVGFVWQNNARNLIHYLSALNNVMLPMQFNRRDGDLRGALKRREWALELLDMVGLGNHAKKKLGQLSGGEQQRVALAIALANRPKILLADEPTGSVDVATCRQIMDIFRKFNRELGITVIIVTHDRTLTHMVNRVVAIRDGKTSSEFLARVHLRERLADITDFEGMETHDEYAVLDRAGRVQIPEEFLKQLGVTGNTIRLAMDDGQRQLVITKPPEGAA